MNTCCFGFLGKAPARSNGVTNGHHGKGIVPADRARLQQLLRSGRLVHPMQEASANFADLAHALALCCGLAPERRVRESHADALAEQLGGTARRHLVFVLCDGMGSSILERHLVPGSFLRKRNDPERLLSVFPATTPAALTTLATAAWPGIHGQPGWDLRDQKGCEFPTKPTTGPVQLRVLHARVTDMRSNRPAEEFGFSEKDVFVAQPWTDLGKSHRHMLYVNAYNGTGFTNWYQGPHKESVRTIPETAMDTLGTPEGSTKALEYFHDAVDGVVAGVKEAEKQGWQSYIYLYTAHPDKHMHPLGVEHPEVAKVVQGIDAELERLWTELHAYDASMVVTADHGHVSVPPSSMVTLPDDLLECLEYANIGVHGKGRHAYFHCRCGRQTEFEERWGTYSRLRDNFLLLTVEAAASEGLFGPQAPLPEVRPRLGDFVAISLGAETLITPEEAANFRDGCSARCQGAHGSLLPEELRIPFILCTPEQCVTCTG